MPDVYVKVDHLNRLNGSLKQILVESHDAAARTDVLQDMIGRPDGRSGLRRPHPRVRGRVGRPAQRPDPEAERHPGGSGGHLPGVAGLRPRGRRQSEAAGERRREPPGSLNGTMR